MAFSSNQKKWIAIGGGIWKVISSLAVLFLFVITITSNFSVASTTTDFNINDHSKVLLEIKPRIEQLKTTSDRHESILQQLREVNIETKVDAEELKQSVQFIRESLVSIQATLANQSNNIQKFWAVDWKDLQNRLDRIESKVDGKK